MPEVLSALTPIAAAPITRSALGLGNASLASAASLQCGRLTLTSGDAVTTSDVSGSTIYFTPWRGNVVSIYDGTDFVPYAFSELSRSISGLTSGKNYDVFAYLSGGSVAIDLAPAWTNDNTRSTAIVLSGHGVYVNNAQFTGVTSSATVPQYRGTLIGTIRTTGTNTTADTKTQRFVANVLNPYKKVLYRADYTQHTYSATTTRGWNNQTQALQWLDPIGLNSQTFSLHGAFLPPGTGTQGGRLGMGPDPTTAWVVLDWYAAQGMALGTTMLVDVGRGFRTFCVTESGTGTGNTTFIYYIFSGEILV